MQLPNEINRVLRLISAAYMSTLPSIPVSMIDRLPNITLDTNPISCMIWNVQGAGSRAFVAALKELIRTHKPDVLALVETHMGENKPPALCPFLVIKDTPALMLKALGEEYGSTGNRNLSRLNQS